MGPSNGQAGAKWGGSIGSIGYPESWMVYFMENQKKWMITGGVPHFRKPPYKAVTV